MSASVNKVMLVGHLGADPDTRTANDRTVCSFSIATNESWNDKNGNKQEKVEWHKIVTWGKLAEICSEYLSRGRQVFVEGKIQTRTYDDKDGIKRYVTEIIAREVQFLGGGGEHRSDGQSSRGDDSPPPPPAAGDDIPF